MAEYVAELTMTKEHPNVFFGRVKANNVKGAIAKVRRVVVGNEDVTFGLDDKSKKWILEAIDKGDIRVEHSEEHEKNADVGYQMAMDTWKANGSKLPITIELAADILPPYMLIEIHKGKSKQAQEEKSGRLKA